MSDCFDHAGDAGAYPLGMHSSCHTPEPHEPVKSVTNTPTPRTDKVERNLGRRMLVEHAKKLERELNGAKDAYRQLQESDNLLYKRMEVAEAERDQLRKVCDELAYELKDLRLSYVGLGGETVLARIESKVALYNSLPHVIERNKSK